MSTRSRQAGFSVVELGIIVVVVVVIGLLGYVFYNNQVNNDVASDESQTSSQPATADDVEQAPAIDSADTLSDAETTLDETDLEGSNSSDASLLDAELSNF